MEQRWAQSTNEVLGHDDVREIEARLAQLDTPLVSDEGRFLERRTMDIHFAIDGDYQRSGLWR